MQKRIALGVEYNGAPFHGWQSQRETIDTIQQRLEEALAAVANHPVSCRCAGRTDRGVHATSQVVHFDTSADRLPKAWVFGTNAHLPPEISVRWAQPVDPEFHARFSALTRRYVYLIYNDPIRSAHLPEALTREARPLDPALMQAGADHLLGEHDFTSFRAADCQSRTPMRNVISVTVGRRGDVLFIDIEANAFLHHMVRNIAGVLMDVGAGVRPPGWVSELLAAKNRSLGSQTADAAGLYLVQVTYPERFGVPSAAAMPHLFALLGPERTD